MPQDRTIVPTFPICHLLGLLCLASLSPPCHGDKPDLDRQIRQTTLEVQRLQGKKQRQEKELAALEKQIGRISLEIRRLKQKTRHLEQQRRRLARELQQQHQALQRQQEQLAFLVRSAYALGRRPALQLLLHLDDPTSAGRMLIYYRYFHQARLERIQAVRQRLAAIRRLEQQIAASERQTAQLVSRQKQRLARLKAVHEQRRRLLEQIQARLKQGNRRLAKLRQDQQRLERLVRSVDAGARPPHGFGGRAFPARRRKLPWPVGGRLVTDFGARRGTGHWEGVVIQAPEGTPVKAIHPGRVIFAGWMPGYGQLLIVRHDHDFMTLYAFNQTLLKGEGDRVREGETIATVGRSGGQDRPGLYFAIRRGSRPVDPKDWCRRPRRGRVE